MTPQRDQSHDDHRYSLDWGPPSAEELRNRRRRIAGTLEGPYAKKPGWFARLMRALGRLMGAQ